MKKYFVVTLTLLLVLGLGLGVSAKTVKEMTDEFSEEISHITTMELQMNVDMGEEYIIIDVRSPEEYAAGHIPGAVNVDFGKLFFSIGNIVKDPETQFIVYCRSGGRSVIATKLLVDLGYKNATNLLGGFMDWAKAGYLVETKHGLFVLEKWEEK